MTASSVDMPVGLRHDLSETGGIRKSRGATAPPLRRVLDAEIAKGPR